MEHVITLIAQLFSGADTLAATLAGAFAAGLVLALRALFALATRLAAATTTAIDDDIVAKTKESFRQQSRDL